MVTFGNNNNNNNVVVFEPCSTIWRGIAKAAVVGMGLTWREGERGQMPLQYFSFPRTDLFVY
jgi:hypothetical protein